MKLKACSLVFSSPLPADLFPGLGESRPRFLLPFAGRFTYLDFLLSPLFRNGVRQHLIVTQHHAELAHNYMETAWGEGDWKVFPFIPDEGDEPFDKQMFSVFKDELAANVFLARIDHPCWFDINDLVNELGMRSKAVQPVFGKKPGGVILVERSLLLEILSGYVKQGVPASGVLHRAFEAVSRHARLKQVQVEGFHLPIADIGQYIRANLAVLDQQDRFRELFARGARVVTVTLGKKGSWTRTPTEEDRTGVIDFPVVDATGAGDTFNSSFVRCLMCGHDIHYAARFANAAASLAVTRLGARGGVASAESIEDAMKKYYR